jgi:hypothetical protein
MNRLSLLLLAFTLACSNPYDEALTVDTIEAWEQYLKENPTGSRTGPATARLEELYIEKARKAEDPAVWDEYVQRFPKGSKLKDVQEERADAWLKWAKNQGTVEAWKRFMENNSKAEKRVLAEAKGFMRVAQAKGSYSAAPVRMEQVNLAERPDGPLDGWGFYVDVTNKGEKPIEMMMMRIDYLNAEGAALNSKKWPVVAKRLPGNLPFEEGFDKPISPGEVRTWEWTDGDLPADWGKKVAVEVIDIKFVGEGDPKAEEEK